MESARKKQILTIREIRAGEEAAARIVFYAALDAVNANLKDKHEAPDADLFDIPGVYGNRPGNIFLVGLVDGRIVATGALTRIDNQRVKLRRMAVHPAWQGRGYGRAMLARLEETAIALSYAEIELDTADLLAAAIGMYIHAGYRETHRETAGDGIQFVYFRKELV